MTERNEAIDVRHNVAASRFEATVDGLLCRADYRLDDGVMRMHHTGIPAQLEGRGSRAGSSARRSGTRRRTGSRSCRSARTSRPTCAGTPKSSTW